MTPELICQRFDFMRSERKNAEGTWDEIRSYIAPFRGEFFRDQTDEHSVRHDYSMIYDGTGIQSNESLASNLHGNLTSPYIAWFHLNFREETLNNDSEARAWLEDVSARIWNTLQESNFSREIAEAYLDLTTFGTACLVEEAASPTPAVWRGINFVAVPLKEMFFEERPDGTVSHFYRGTMMTPLQMVEKFGEKNVPDDVKDKAKGPTASSEKEMIVFCVYPRFPETGLSGKRETATKLLAAKKRPYGYRYIRLRDKSELGDEGGYYEMPAYVTRWNKVSDSKWGHGPSHIALYDVKTLNRQEELTLQALAKVVDPPQKTTERGLLGDLDMRPAGLTILRNMNDLAPIETGTDWRAVDMERQQRRAMIREYYLVSRLDLKESPAMTATEVERRWQQMTKLLGPTLGRLQSDLLEPLVETTFAILARAGLLPAMPPIVQQQGGELDIEFTGPMPLAQKQDAALAIESEFALAANLAQVHGPDVLDVLDATAGLREHARLKGVPAKLVRSEAQIKKRQDERKAQQAQAQQMAMATQGAQAMKDAAQGAKAGAEAAQIEGGGGEASNVIQMPGAAGGGA